MPAKGHPFLHDVDDTPEDVRRLRQQLEDILSAERIAAQNALWEQERQRLRKAIKDKGKEPIV